jgi:hypothetical protein
MLFQSVKKTKKISKKLKLIPDKDAEETTAIYQVKEKQKT